MNLRYTDPKVLPVDRPWGEEESVISDRKLQLLKFNELPTEMQHFFPFNVDNKTQRY